MKRKIEIVFAEPDEVPNLASLRGGGQQLEQTMLQYLQGTYSPQFAMLDRAVLIAKVDSNFAGYAAGHRSTRFGCEGELQWLNVAEPHRGQEVSSALMDNILDWFLANTIYRVCVNVDPNNFAARRVYARHEAEVLNDHWMVWHDLRQSERSELQSDSH